MIIGITGGFGTGKSTVANMFMNHGFRVINVDKLYHNIFKNNLILKFKIKKEFGTLDRNKIKEIVFDDSKKLKKLNLITHPVIIKTLKREIIKVKKHQRKKINKKNKIIKNSESENIGDVRIVVDVPLLFEAKMERMFDIIVVVKCSRKTQINRILKRKKYSKKEIEQIIKSQMPLKDKIKRADFIVDNDKSMKNTNKQLINLMTSI